MYYGQLPYSIFDKLEFRKGNTDEIIDKLNLSWYDFFVLVETVWGEARGEGAKGMKLVCHVIINRYERLHSRRVNRGPLHVADICKKPAAFSYWDLKTGDKHKPDLLDVHKVNAPQNVADALQEPDFTNGATHYHRKGMKFPPYWAEGETPCYEYRNHICYKLRYL